MLEHVPLRMAAEFKEHLYRIRSTEIPLAKIVRFRYIAFTFLIRYLDVRIALACEDIPKAYYPFRFCRNCIGRGRPTESRASAFPCPSG